MKKLLHITALSCAALAFYIPAVSAAETTAHPMPDCTVTSLSDNKSYPLSALKGKVLYVDFWASWCGPCVQSFPFMNKLQQDFKDQGLEIVAVNMDEVLSDAQNFLNQHPAKFTVATDAQQTCAKAFDVKAMPSSYLIDRSGMIRHEHLGFRAGEAEQMQGLIKQLLTEKPVK